MSNDMVYHNYCETLTMRGGRDPRVIRAIFAYQFSLLGALLLQNVVGIPALRLKTENGEWSFSGNEVTHDLQEIAGQLMTAKDIDYSIRYHYISGGPNTLSLLAGPDEMMKTLTMSDEARKCFGLNVPSPVVTPTFEGMVDSENSPEPPRLLPVKGSGFFYSCWSDLYREDKDTYGGPDEYRLFAFGEKDGKLYSGDVSSVRVSLPECAGKWRSPDTDIRFEALRLSPESEPELCAMTEHLKSYTSPECVTLPDGRTVCEVGQTTLSSPEEIRDYAETASLMRKFGGISAIEGTYFDEETANQIRELDIRSDSYGEPMYFLTQV